MNKLPDEVVKYIVDNEITSITNVIDGQECGGKVVMLANQPLVSINSNLYGVDIEFDGLAWLPTLIDADECRQLAANKGVTLDEWDLENTIPIVILGRQCFGEAFFTFGVSEADDE